MSDIEGPIYLIVRSGFELEEFRKAEFVFQNCWGVKIRRMLALWCPEKIRRWIDWQDLHFCDLNGGKMLEGRREHIKMDEMMKGGCENGSWMVN